MRRVLTAIALGIAAAVVTLFAGAVAIAILNLYLTGHGIRWQEGSPWGPGTPSYLDLALLACCALAFLAVVLLFLFGPRLAGNARTGGG